MNYSLGNTLSRGGSLNADGLSLNLQFATDKTLVARKGPTPTFTRASTATFIGSNGLIQSAAINEARFDHDPITLACKGLLMEESRTNLALRSDDFANATWSKAFCSISSNTSTAPDGNITADELIEDSTTNGHTCIQSTATATIGTTYTFSVFVKRKDTSNQFLLIGASGLVTASFISVNLTNGVTATNIGSPGIPTNVSSTTYPNGWYRVQFSVVATSASAALFDIRLSRDGTWANRSYLGDGVQSSLLWGAQIEAASFPTSYIPTTTASVVRSADVCSITGADFTGMYNEFAGTVLCESTLNGVSPSVTPNTAIFGGPQNGISMRENTGTPSLFGIIAADEDNYFDSSMGNTPSGTARKSAMTFQNDGSAILCLDGTLGTQDNSIILPIDSVGGVTPAELILFRGQFSTVKSFRYYKKRLANAKLQSLTT